MSGFEQCCNPGTLWQGSPSGKEIKLGGLNTYLAVPPAGSTPKAGILFLSDIFGWKVNNARLFTDRLAKAGFVVACPDFFNGDAVTPERKAEKDFSLPEWLKQFSQEQVLSQSNSIIAELKSSHNVQSIGAIGFCWGGLYALKLNASSTVQASVVNHCSLLPYNKEVPDQIAQPVLFQCPDNDAQMPAELRHEIEEKLSQKPFKRHTLVKFYPGQEHGWTLRGDDKDPSVQWAAEEAFEAGAFFFNIHLSAANSS